MIRSWWKCAGHCFFGVHMNVKGVEYGGMSLQLSQPRCSNESEPFLMRRANAKALQVISNNLKSRWYCSASGTRVSREVIQTKYFVQVVAGTLDVSLSWVECIVLNSSWRRLNVASCLAYIIFERVFDWRPLSVCWIFESNWTRWFISDFPQGTWWSLVICCLQGSWLDKWATCKTLLLAWQESEQITYHKSTFTSWDEC